MGRTILLLILSNVFTGSMFFLTMDTTELYKSPLILVPIVTGSVLVVLLTGFIYNNWED